MSDNSTIESVELTNGLFQVLLNLTGGDPDLQQPKIRSLVRALHGARLVTTSRWVVELTEEDVRTVHDVLQVHFLNNPYNETRFSNHMCAKSEVYHRIFHGRSA